MPIIFVCFYTIYFSNFHSLYDLVHTDLGLPTFNYITFFINMSEPSSPRIWCFFSPYDIPYYSAQALHFMNPTHDKVIVDGRTDRTVLQRTMRQRQIPASSVFIASNTTKTTTPYHRYLTQPCERERLISFLNGPSHAKSSNRVYTIVPFTASSPEFIELLMILRKTTTLELKVSGEEDQWTRLYGNKGIVHPRVGEETSVWSRMIGDVPHLQIPKGRLCITAADIHSVWCEWGKPSSVVIKDIDSSGGAGVHFVGPNADGTALELVDKHADGTTTAIALGQTDIIVEEDLRLRHKHLEFLAIQYDGTTLSPVIKQQFLPGNRYSGSFTVEQNDAVILRMKEGVQEVVRRLAPTHRGGFDICVGDKNRLYILDINTSRYNGTDTARALCSWWAPDTPHCAFFTTIKTPPYAIYEVLRQEGSGQWAEVISYACGTARWVVSGDNPAICTERQEHIQRRLCEIIKRGPPQPSSPQKIASVKCIEKQSFWTTTLQKFTHLILTCWGVEL